MTTKKKRRKKEKEVRSNLTVNGKRIYGTKWYWMEWHAGADEQAGCPARRLARWATRAGNPVHLYYWKPRNQCVVRGALALCAPFCTPLSNADAKWAGGDS